MSYFPPLHAYNISALKNILELLKTYWSAGWIITKPLNNMDTPFLTAHSNSRLLLWAIIKCLCNIYPFYKTSHIFHIHRKPVYRMHQTSKNHRRGPSLQFVEGIFPKNKINMEICHHPISDFSFGPNMLGLLGFYRPYIHKHAQNMETRKC